MNFKPFPFWKSHIIKSKLTKSTPYRVIYQSHTPTAYSNLTTNTIYLPFIEPLEYGDLVTLLKHEEKHFKVTKKPAYISTRYNIAKAQKILNILEDIIINEGESRSRLERIFKKLGTDSEQITLWGHFSEEEKKKIVDKLKGELFKKDVSTEKIIEVMEKVIKTRKKYDSLREFVYREESVFDEYYRIFVDKSEKYERGDGPCEYDSSYYRPETGIVKTFEKILRNFNIKSSEIFYEKNYIGKRINRSFLENLTEIKPFKRTKEILEMKRPKIIILLDCSGSMKGEPEKLAKAFIVACLRQIDCKVIAHNQYYHIETDNEQTIIKLPMTGDEWFNTINPKMYKTDILAVITDMNISDEEAIGLRRFGEAVKAVRKYILCVRNNSKHEELNGVYRRVYIGEKEKFIDFVKRLVYQF